MPNKVSIIMGVFNCSDTLSDALDSILAQTYQNWELILCDDGSTDDTYRVASEYCGRYPGKIVLLQNEKNMGLNHTLNRCLAAATGVYIARMDGDDISLPERLSLEVAFLDAHPEYAIVSCPMIYFDDDTAIMGLNRNQRQSDVCLVPLFLFSEDFSNQMRMYQF